MPVIPDAAIAVAARKAGFSKKETAKAVAVALGESGGRSDAIHHESNGSTSYGLWQINTVHEDLLSSGSWQNPLDNARMAFAVWSRNGNSWRPWGAYNNNSYLLFVPRGITAAAIAETSSAIPDIPVIPDVPGVSEVKAFFNFITDKHNWQRLGYIIIGGGLLLIVLVALLKNSGVTETAVDTGKSVAKLVVLKGKGKAAA